jgi:hypothetical protein
MHGADDFRIIRSNQIYQPQFLESLELILLELFGPERIRIWLSAVEGHDTKAKVSGFCRDNRAAKTGPDHDDVEIVLCCFFTYETILGC